MDSRLKQGDWMCPDCNAHNFAFRKDCYKCKGGSSKTMSSSSPYTKSSTTTKRNDDRQYKKSYDSSGSSDRSDDGGHKYQSSRGGGETRVKAGDFFCSKCGAHNFASRDRCYKCNKAKDPELEEMGTREVKNGDWFCELCNFHNFASRKSCLKCEESSQFQKSVKESGDQTCPKCAFQNFARRTTCKECGESLGAAYIEEKKVEGDKSDVPTGGDHQGKVNMKKGDWMCSECDAHNFATRNKCFKCQNLKPFE